MATNKQQIDSAIKATEEAYKHATTARERTDNAVNLLTTPGAEILTAAQEVAAQEELAIQAVDAAKKAATVEDAQKAQKNAEDAATAAEEKWADLQKLLIVDSQRAATEAHKRVHAALEAAINAVNSLPPSAPEVSKAQAAIKDITKYEAQAKKAIAAAKAAKTLSIGQTAQTNAEAAAKAAEDTWTELQKLLSVAIATEAYNRAHAAREAANITPEQIALITEIEKNEALAKSAMEKASKAATLADVQAAQTDAEKAANKAEETLANVILSSIEYAVARAQKSAEAAATSAQQAAGYAKSERVVIAQSAALAAATSAQQAADEAAAKRVEVETALAAKNTGAARISAEFVNAAAKRAALAADRAKTEKDNATPKRGLVSLKDIDNGSITYQRIIRIIAGGLAFGLFIYIAKQKMPGSGTTLWDLMYPHWPGFWIIIALGFLLYRPRRPIYTTLNATAQTQADQSPLPFTHPAVLALGIYMVIFTLLCLGLVLEIGAQVTSPLTTPTPSATITPEKTPEATETPAPQVSVMKAKLRNLAAEATETVTAEPTQEPTAEATAPAETVGISSKSDAPPTPTPLSPYTIHLLDRQIEVTPESRLLLLIVLSGALGGLLKAIQSYRLYLGENNFKSRWIMYYVTEPFVGGVLALLFYVVVRGGLFSNDSIQSANTFGLVATSGLVGLFNGQAMKKLKQLADTVFTPNVGTDATLEDQKKQKEANTPSTATKATVIEDPKTGMIAGVVQQEIKKDETAQQ